MNRAEIQKAIEAFKAKGGEIKKIEKVEQPISVPFWEERFFGGKQDPFGEQEIDFLRLTK